ncbi:MAG: DUF2953 domain-containing protein [Lachnospiraceae bacterium]|nr:DUF2953 domain-containing protein [Lachnospiraceae bacterium]
MAFTVLTIIGIILLAVIALILLILALILFVPVRYRITADRLIDSGEMHLLAKASYLLHIVTAAFAYDKETDAYIKIFGIRLKGRGKKEEEPESVSDGPDHAGGEEEPVNEEPDANELTEDDFTIDWNDDPVYSHDPDEDETGDTGSEEQLSDKEETKSLEDKIEDIVDTVINKYEEFCSKYEKVRYNVRFWEKMYNDTKNRKAAELAKTQLIKLLKKAAPRRIKGNVHFGFEDPATTGKILMYLSMIYPIMPRKLKIEPSFEDTKIYGDIMLKGHLALIVPVMCFLRLYFSKECRRMWRLYKKHSGK